MVVFNLALYFRIRTPGFALQNIAGFGVAQCREISWLISQANGGAKQSETISLIPNQALT
jgi:hypothetical protein